MIFLDRSEAGERIADRLTTHRMHEPVVVVMQLGAIRIGWEIAKRLQAPMDVLLARDVYIPGPASILIGGVADGEFYPDEATLDQQKVGLAYAQRLAWREFRLQSELEVKTRGKLPRLDVFGRTVVLVSDGWISCAAVDAAVQSLLAKVCRKVIYVSPVCSPDLFQRVSGKSQMVTLFEPENYRSVMLVHEGYRQTTEDEAVWLIERSRQFQAPQQPRRAWEQPEAVKSGRGGLDREPAVELSLRRSPAVR
jgi:putative phosphoribosyl transferase